MFQLQKKTNVTIYTSATNILANFVEIIQAWRKKNFHFDSSFYRGLEERHSAVQRCGVAKFFGAIFSKAKTSKRIQQMASLSPLHRSSTKIVKGRPSLKNLLPTSEVNLLNRSEYIETYHHFPAEGICTLLNLSTNASFPRVR